MIQDLLTQGLFESEIFYYLDVNSMSSLSKVNKSLRKKVLYFFSRHPNLFDDEINSKISELIEKEKKLSEKLEEANDKYKFKKELLSKIKLRSNLGVMACLALWIGAHTLYNTSQSSKKEIIKALKYDAVLFALCVLSLNIILCSLDFLNHLLNKSVKQADEEKEEATKKINKVKTGWQFFKEEKDKKEKQNLIEGKDFTS